MREKVAKLGLWRKCALVGVLFIASLTLTSLGVNAISRGYVTEDTSIKPGMAIMLSEASTADTPRVEKASSEQPDKFVGIASKVEDSTVTIASAAQSVYVETEGEVTAFVSDMNGSVKQGDQLTISPLRGILAKSDKGAKIVLGTALEDFSLGKGESHEIKTSDGTKVVTIASLRLNLGQKSILGADKVDSSLERLGKSIAGKEVSEIRVIVALLIFIIVILAEGSILYGAISSAVTALGRNPLAKTAIKKELFQIAGVAVAVLAVGLGAVYLVLWA